ncbi:conserved hypothetical protein [Leishmania major strain Friedlin]|uniref:Uncharacterized protein n=1 Tax=Leishmania major TaxID=5664 RepID=E9AD61_LEIMA|nr:conserved hypothetical protein [Leishmania major strain Friedlin]CAG9576685.1 hypothetical_protein_-_conserved [Leishmania major strain Friedlin]CBZ12145.1 conserved hypothetical protein [Leishmania major strain Friedlin]|eukprot:XP_003721890.1 conserved hypothetical protein [Leishmania major strain Friedlin]
MLRIGRRSLAVVTAAAITDAATKLNALLDIKHRTHPAPQGEIKRFLKTEVMPVLAGTELDRRGNSTDLRHFLGQLTRDAAFAAVIVGARPEASFVQAIVTCIKEDHQRMRFLPKMSSPQASKIVEYLCKAGVTDTEVYPVLISRLNFGTLNELGRVMFALTESGFHALNMLVVVPLYSGEQWVLDFDKTKRKRNASSCSAFDAVRVLRALSKSCRAYVEECRRAPKEGMTGVPSESLNLLRNNLLRFIFENASVLRGAHWLNVARALLNFPREFSELRNFVRDYPAIEKEVRSALGVSRDSTVASSSHDAAAPCAVNCETVGAAAMQCVFQYAEQRSVIEDVGVGCPVSAEFPFDLSYGDLVKLLPLLDQFPRMTSAQKAQQRAELVLRVMCANVHRLRLQDLVAALQALRRIRPSATATAAVETIAQEAGNRLTVSSAEEVLDAISFRTVARLAAALAALRVNRCDGFVTFVTTRRDIYPSSLTVDTALSFINALAALKMTRSSLCHGALESILRGVLNFYRQQLRNGPLLDAFPIFVARMLRGCVLLDYIPPAPILQSLLGSAEAPLRMSDEVHSADGVLVFDLSRSLSHFLKQARATAPEREKDLWDVGVVRVALPLAVACTEDTVHAMENYRQASSSSHTAVSWRSTVEMLALFIDPQMNSTDRGTMVQRLLEVFSEVEALMRAAATATRAHLEQCSRHIHHADEARQRSRQTPFNANCNVHFLSALLIFEYVIFHANTKAGRLPSSVAGQPTTSVLGDVEKDTATLAGLKNQYCEFLRTPISESVTDTPMDIVRRIFECPLSGPIAGSAAAPPTVVLLEKTDAVEITTTLPFALSLAMDPGPVNEFFTERCMSIMVSDAEEAH